MMRPVDAILLWIGDGFCFAFKFGSIATQLAR